MAIAQGDTRHLEELVRSVILRVFVCSKWNISNILRIYIYIICVYIYIISIYIYIYYHLLLLSLLYIYIMFLLYLSQNSRFSNGVPHCSCVCFMTVDQR